MTESERRNNMKEPKITVKVDSEGVVVEAKDMKGEPIQYDPEEVELGRSIIGATLQTGASPACCWRMVGGVWKCRRRYCR